MSEAMTTAEKKCVQCGTDVTHGKRMKDSKGQYWCVACGAMDQTKKHGGTTMSQCPVCEKMFAPVDAHRVGEQYVCPACASQPGGSRGNVESSDARKARAKKLVLGGALLVIGAGLIVGHFTGFIDEFLY